MEEDCEESSSARAFYSCDFDWQELREEIEGARSPEVGSTGIDVILEAERSRGADGGKPAFCPSAWEAFHRNHSKALFFKERRYLVKEFPELVDNPRAISVLEVGCGTGSSVAPILRANKNATCYGCDCSAAALDRAELLVAGQAGLLESQNKKFRPFLCDISVQSFPSWLCCSSCRATSLQSCGPSQDDNGVNSRSTSAEQMQQSSEGSCCVGGVSIVMLIFTLSAIPLERMRHVLAECAAVLRPGGHLLFRDYGLYDMTMLRFPSAQKLADRLYFRKDGTLSYFFSLEVVRELLTSVGLVEEELQYACVQLVNRRKQVPMKRVWVHAKFTKPETAAVCTR
ncbi:hypothetical protein MPTK1_8g06430 [Marchantia polymorpha subsp. ruderalis]|uniref:Methyltransferase-like protein n=1 Tax=Marchantia polymorpha TaxID=3197 RepID=A0A2R6XIK8_MARPO|nr:hypothetical protein MARPO_0013s0147 [Marchantia polymorpha]BBN18899.1 hypothetical protein Mp_8g06430 [Marchantia polymorpha subsp. ruderalis]|eukprot:PTQ45943.1 hypothetical protein MARPO_0013s0147 [Marchantia polymorpha]